MKKARQSVCLAFRFFSSFTVKNRHNVIKGVVVILIRSSRRRLRHGGPLSGLLLGPAQVLALRLAGSGSRVFQDLRLRQIGIVGSKASGDNGNGHLILHIQMCIRDSQYALILTSSDQAKTVQLIINELIGSIGAINWGGIMAMGVVVTIPVVILFALVQKWLIEGLTSGAVKG